MVSLSSSDTSVFLVPTSIDASKVLRIRNSPPPNAKSHVRMAYGQNERMSK